MNDRTCQKWFAKLHARDFSLDDAPPWGRPLQVDSNKIKTLTESNQLSITWKKANKLKNIQINKIVVENENVSLISWKKLN